VRENLLLSPILELHILMCWKSERRNPLPFLSYFWCFTTTWLYWVCWFTKTCYR